MKSSYSIKSIIKYSTVSAFALSTPSFAIERPNAAAQPEEKLPLALTENAAGQKENLDQAIPMPQVNPQDSAFLGVFGDPVTKALSNHLNLPEGTGVELKIVAPNSPAAIAGLQLYDIITSINGNKITSVDDIHAAVDQKKPGEKITLDFITKGKPASKEITLGARNVPRNFQENLPQGNQGLKNRAGAQILPDDFLNKFPKGDREKLKQLFNGKLAEEEQQGPDLNNLQNRLNLQMNKEQNLNGEFHSRVKMLDQNGSITLETTKEGKVIELLDREGKLQYKGPYNNEADKKNVPNELRPRVENLNIDKGIGNLDRQNPLQLNAQQQRLRLQKMFLELQNMNNNNPMQFPKAMDQLMNQQEANLLNLDINKNALTTTRTDPATGYTFTFMIEDKSKQIEIYDPQGKLIYNGPYNNEIDKASLPDQYRGFADKIDASSSRNGNKLMFKMGQ